MEGPRLDRGDFGLLLLGLLADREMYGYELLKQLNKITEEVVEPEYFEILRTALYNLDKAEVPLELTAVWATMQLLRLTGHMPNLETDLNGGKLSVNEKYIFSFDDMAFAPSPAGETSAPLIKLLRLSASVATPEVLARVQGAASQAPEALNLVNKIAQFYLFG